MAGDRSRYGLAVSALGAVVLAISVFLPWYGVSLTATGVAFTQQIGSQVAAEYGNASFQALVGALHADLGGLAGHQFVALTAHQALHDLNIFLLILATLAMLDAILPLARAGGSLPAGAGGSVVILGSLAAICVLYRMIDPPTPAGNLLSLSLREGSWLALLGSMAMVLGGLWPRAVSSPEISDSQMNSAFAQLSGWTPSA
jgi:hypothetical protein